MVRGIIIKLQFPYAHFGTKDVNVDVLLPIIWEAIHQLENVVCKAICIVADGASPNRRFSRMHGGKDLVYKAHNPFACLSENCPLFFISDPPHILKTTRNCWSYSGNFGTRRLSVRICNTFSVRCINQQINGQCIEWKHLRDLYRKLQTMSAGISLVPKLKLEHVELTPFFRMRVDLTAQVLLVT